MPDHIAFAEIAARGENFCLAIGHKADNGKAHIDAIYERVPPFSPESCIAGFSALLRKRGITSVTGDRHSSRWPVEAFGRHGIAYKYCKLVRPDLYRDFRALLDANKVELPEHETLRQQLGVFTQRQKNHGGPDDVLACVAGVCVLAAGAYDRVKEIEHADWV